MPHFEYRSFCSFFLSFTHHAVRSQAILVYSTHRSSCVVYNARGAANRGRHRRRRMTNLTTQRRRSYLICTAAVLLNRREWKRLKGCVFSHPVLARGREARKHNPSIASLPTPLHYHVLQLNFVWMLLVLMREKEFNMYVASYEAHDDASREVAQYKYDCWHPFL